MIFVLQEYSFTRSPPLTAVFPKSKKISQYNKTKIPARKIRTGKMQIITKAEDSHLRFDSDRHRKKWDTPLGYPIFWCRCPVAVPDKIFGLTLSLDFIDRCHSLPSLLPPLAALGSLPRLSPPVRFRPAQKKMGHPFGVSHFLVLVTGLEPVRNCFQGILSPWCLPIPPHQHIQFRFFVFKGKTSLHRPVVILDIFLAVGAASSAIDHCHSLRSLLPPQAALPSLPTTPAYFACSPY